MKIRLIHGMVGDTFNLAAGEVIERDEVEAKSLIAHGIAEPVAEKIETASVKPAKETAKRR